MPSDADFLPMAAPFRQVRKGYDPEQVDEFCDRADAELRVTAADRDAAASQAADLAHQLDGARAEIEALRAAADRLAALPHDTEGLSNRLQRMLRLAQDEASDIRARAEAESAEVRSVAEQESAGLREEYESLIEQVQRQRSEMIAEHTAAMTAAHAQAQALLEAATVERDRCDAEAAARRARITEDFELAMVSRRAEALATLQRDESTSKAEAERRVRDATTEAQRRLQRATEQSEQRVAAATATVEMMRDLRARIAGRLADLRTLLDQAPPMLQELPEETRQVTTSDE
jgi:DivIVA domain-containing protein